MKHLPKIIFGAILYLLGSFLCDYLKAHGTTDPFIFFMLGALASMIVDSVDITVTKE